ncbi:hypothetical protein BKX96_12405 [Pseudomonas putida]|nr:hypothetical protein BKX96_12405 [Pseudomonas putida]
MIGIEHLQHRTLLIGGQQRGIGCTTLTPLLRQQLITMLDDRIAHRPLYLGGQPAFAVKALALRDIWQCMTDQSIKGVVVVLAEQGFTRRCHGGGAPKVRSAEAQYWRFGKGWVLAELIGVLGLCVGFAEQQRAF